ncbi:MbcA/ParS/Xre antitoxin family protein [Acidovorax sp. 100]|uniref:MbcA/ParS/Xre antitoxin family protein n=1 Tax=Acidovorax sp. 100 TaxID=2135635 RepID=UPI000EFA0A89|nr:MbcA/ParS/Xre antitoxin family protein [Acidovorax sp. 100]
MAHTNDAHLQQVLTDLVQQIVVESGNPEGFNAEAWLQEWLAAPLPAFGNRRPLDVLQEPEGLAVVRATLLQIQKGSFA